MCLICWQISDIGTVVSPRHLAGRVEPLHDDEVDHEPGHDEGGQQLPLHPAQVRDAVGDAQHAAAARGASC